MQAIGELRPWTWLKLKKKQTTIIKDFSKPRHDPQRFTEKIRIILSTYNPGLPDLHQLLHMLVGTSDAESWMAKGIGLAQ